MSSRKYAVTFGRYNLVTNAHLNTVKTILREWQYLTIGVIDLTFQSPVQKNNEWRYFLEMCDKNCQSPGSFVFDIQEKIRMWKSTIEQSKLTRRVQVVSVKRPEYFNDEFNKSFPRSKYDLVFPQAKTESSEFDLLRNKAFSSILNRCVLYVNPTLTLHTTEIRAKVESGETWEKFMPHGAYHTFREIKRCDPNTSGEILG